LLKIICSCKIVPVRAKFMYIDLKFRINLKYIEKNERRQYNGASKNYTHDLDTDTNQ